MNLKRLTAIILSFVLAISLAGTTTAASKAQPLKLVLDGVAVELNSSIVMSKGKTFVEFRALLEVLGYEVAYDSVTRTIRAQTEGTTVEFSLGGDVAFVNGKTVPSKDEVITKNGRTLVGLRFAGVISDYKVEWNDKTQTVTLTSIGATAAQKVALFKLFDDLLIIEANGALQGLPALFTEDTVVDVEALQEGWADTKTRTTYLKKNIEAYSDTEAVILISDETVKLSGSFFPDNKSQVRYLLKKHADDKQWKIYDMELVELEYTNLQQLFKEKAAIPAAEQAAIRDVFEEQLKATSDENVAAYLATLVDSEEKAALTDEIKQLFDTSTMNTVLEEMTIVEYNSTDHHATLLISLVSEVERNGITTKVRVVILNGAEKVNGKWLLRPETVTLYSEQQ
jgi:predicted RNA binding protein with dsRBD fold (UPF0201 family)